MSASKSKTPLLDFLQEAEMRHQEVESEKEKIMRARGWTHTCSTPGSLWMWEKKLPDGRTVLTNLETAIAFEVDMCGELELCAQEEIG